MVKQQDWDQKDSGRAILDMPGISHSEILEQCSQTAHVICANQGAKLN